MGNYPQLPRAIARGNEVRAMIQSYPKGDILGETLSPAEAREMVSAIKASIAELGELRAKGETEIRFVAVPLGGGVGHLTEEEAERLWTALDETAALAEASAEVARQQRELSTYSAGGL